MVVHYALLTFTSRLFPSLAFRSLHDVKKMLARASRHVLWIPIREKSFLLLSPIPRATSFLPSKTITFLCVHSLHTFWKEKSSWLLDFYQFTQELRIDYYTALNTMPPAPTIDTSALAAGSVSSKFLDLILSFDEMTNAESWATSSIKIGIATVIVLTIIHKVLGKAMDVNWCSLIHAIVVGLMSFVGSWLDVFAAEALTGTPQPLLGVICKGPLTTWHSIVPAITMGYGIFDLQEGIRLGKKDFVSIECKIFVYMCQEEVNGWDCNCSNTKNVFLFRSLTLQIAHGVATLSIMAYFCYYGIPEIIMPMLLMEISTINLVFMGAKMSASAALVNIIFFVLSFTIFRMIIVPKLWWDIFVQTWVNKNNPESQACLPWHFTYIVFVFGMFFNCLNTFWFRKIVKKVQRKISGSEAITAQNHVKHS